MSRILRGLAEVIDRLPFVIIEFVSTSLSFVLSAFKIRVHGLFDLKISYSNFGGLVICVSVVNPVSGNRVQICRQKMK